MTPIKYKVFAYITNQNRLLLFRHLDFPEAGIQVPAGTVRSNEDLAVAVLREAHEETGLSALTLGAYLGEHIRNMLDVGLDEIHHRHFFHLCCEDNPPSQWQHNETDPSEGSLVPIRFEFFWVDIWEPMPELICDHGEMLSTLRERIVSGG